MRGILSARNSRQRNSGDGKMKRTPIEPVERMHAAHGYRSDGVSQFSARNATGRAKELATPKVPRSHAEAEQQNRSRVGRLRAQLATETNVQLRLNIMRELTERLIGTPEQPC
jgi:hypothetical protein